MLEWYMYPSLVELPLSTPDSELAIFGFPSLRTLAVHSKSQQSFRSAQGPTHLPTISIID